MSQFIEEKSLLTCSLIEGLNGYVAIASFYGYRMLFSMREEKFACDLIGRSYDFVAILYPPKEERFFT